MEVLEDDDSDDDIDGGDVIMGDGERAPPPVNMFSEWRKRRRTTSSPTSSSSRAGYLSITDQIEGLKLDSRVSIDLKEQICVLVKPNFIRFANSLCFSVVVYVSDPSLSFISSDIYHCTASG